MQFKSRSSRLDFGRKQGHYLSCSTLECAQQAQDCIIYGWLMTDLRKNEQAVDLVPASDAVLRFIGTIRTPWQSREACPRQGSHDGPECQLVLDPVWHDALRGLEDCQMIEVLYWLDKSRRDLTLQSPKSDGRTKGTFALRSPVRPNPIGSSVVQLEKIDAGTVFVRGLDSLDGTPLLDIKPDRCAFTPKAPWKPGESQAQRK